MSFKKVLFIACLSFMVTGIASAQTYSYIGAMKCKMCHNTEKSGYQYKIWSESGHAKSMASLSSQKSLDYAKANGIADPTKDQKCLKCHSTAASVDQNLVETITVAEGVSCESCHGPGSAYKTNTIMKDKALAQKNGLIIPDQKTCEKCHNKDNPFYKPFDFATASKKIAHPIPPATGQ